MKDFIVHWVKAKLQQCVLDAIDDCRDEANFLGARGPAITVIEDEEGEQFVIMSRDDFEDWYGEVNE